LPNTDSRLRSREHRTQSICWLMTANNWPTPNSAVNTSRAAIDAPDAHSPAPATTINPEPIQVASASWPRSMKRPSQTAMNTGRTANVADTIPRQTTGRPSSTMR
jgi:hypothetical protein